VCVVLFMLSKFSFSRFLSVADLGEAYTLNVLIIICFGDSGLVNLSRIDFNFKPYMGCADRYYE
jgi:hypothetical protein